MPASAGRLAVPPVERISTSRWARPRANSITPRLSLTLTSARRTLLIELLDVPSRHAPAHRRQHLVRDRVVPTRHLVGADLRPGLPPEHHHRLADADVLDLRHADP